MLVPCRQIKSVDLFTKDIRRDQLKTACSMAEANQLPLNIVCEGNSIATHCRVVSIHVAQQRICHVLLALHCLCRKVLALQAWRRTGLQHLAMHVAATPFHKTRSSHRTSSPNPSATC